MMVSPKSEKTLLLDDEIRSLYLEDHVIDDDIEEDVLDYFSNLNPAIGYDFEGSETGRDDMER